jgi:hypothetical protein
LKLKSAQNISESDLESFKSEIRAKEECIQKMRQELLVMQEKRDCNMSEIEAHANKSQQLESRLFFLEDEVS